MPRCFICARGERLAGHKVCADCHARWGQCRLCGFTREDPEPQRSDFSPLNRRARTVNV